MVNVWAYRTEKLGTTFKVAGEWNQVVEFDTLADLLDKFKKANLSSGQVGKLGIVAHGDAPGIVQLKPKELSTKTAHQYAGDFAGLCNYLSKNARVIFYSCIAGASTGGSFLLNELSKKHFPYRHVIGFERHGAPGVNAGEPAGTIRCSTGGMPPYLINSCEPTATMKPVTDRRRKDEQILNEYSIYAKWSYDGKIIKLPYDERIVHINSIPEVRCGPGAVEQAVNDPETHKKINYIAIRTERPPALPETLVNLYGRLISRGFTFSKTREWVPSKDPDLLTKRFVEFSPEDAKLVRAHHGILRPHEEIVAVFKTEPATKYKCSSRSCPGLHLNFTDTCDNSVALIPNGPFF